MYLLSAKRVILLLLIAAVLTGAIAGFAQPSSCEATTLVITFIDVGQGDSALVKSPDGRYLLIDAGEYRNVASVIAKLRSSGVTKLDFVIATHPHSDHVGGLSEVFRQFPVGASYDIGRIHATSSYQYYLEAVKASKAKFLLIRSGTSFKLGSSVTATFIWPYQQMPSDFNDASAAMIIKYGDFEALFMADCGAETEAQLVKAGKIPEVELLKVGHHGSRHSSTTEFLKASSPELGIISAGAGNDYGYPQADTLKQLKDAGVEVLRTDINGNIEVSSDGKTWWAAATDGTQIRQKAAAQVAPKPSLQASAVYVGSQNSTVFHLQSCEAVAAISKANLIIYASRDEALSKGKRPCKICNP